MPLSGIRAPALAGLHGEAVLRRLRRRALLVSGIGFFTDAYDLFVIGIVSTLLKTHWHLGTSQVALLNAVMLGAAFLGAVVLGRIAGKIGRTRARGSQSLTAPADLRLAVSLGLSLRSTMRENHPGMVCSGWMAIPRPFSSPAEV